MVGFHLPDILQRKTRPHTIGNSSPQVEMTGCDSPQQGSQQDDSHNSPSPNAQKSSWSSRYFPSALASRYGATRPAIPSSSITARAAASPSKGVRNKSSSNNSNNISRLPPSVKRNPSDSTSRTPTRNTDTPIPTIIHPSTPLHPSSSSFPPPPPSPSRSSPTRTKPRSTRHSTPRKSILKVPTATAAANDNEMRQQVERYHCHTSQSDTRDNTSRNALLTLSYTSSQDDACPRARPGQSPFTQQRRSSLPSTTPSTPLLALGDGNIIHPPLSNRETKLAEPYGYDRESGNGGGEGKSKRIGKEEEKAQAQASVSSRSSCHRSKRHKQKNREKMMKMVRFDHIDVHPYEVERGEESRSRFFGQRGEGGVEGRGNEYGSVGNRGADVELDFDLDLREYVMDIPDVIEG
ncbi:hypothetical protein EMCG_00712 [[Emmonsia] crescens]|uniref:Uncharacterized protein n=1 Tax=[Emmonsia] crescens TaxID=73230 RepID=A0A0G2J6Y3_9EURO|nr:hypothetical protein EMCG_00712 [Emmonsia crescens UAMH 3008]